MTYAVLAFFAILLVRGIAKKYWFGSIYLIAVYLLMLLFSLGWLKENTELYRPTVVPSVVFCLMILLYFVPFFRVGNNLQLTGFRDEAQKNRFIKLGFTISVIIILMMVAIAPAISNAFSIGLEDVRSDMYAEESEVFSGSVIERLGRYMLKWMANLCYPILIMFFYSVCFLKRNVLLKVFLFIASLSRVFFTMSVGSRSSVIYYLLFFIVCIILFYPYLGKRSRILTFSFASFFLVVIIGYFIMVSNLRAEYTGNDYLLRYAGQSYANFCDYFDNLNWHANTLRRVLPLSSYLLGGKWSLAEYDLEVLNKTGMELGQFSTMMGTFFIDMGIIGLLVYSLIYNRVANFVMKSKVFDLTQLLWLGIIIQVPLHGVFYYSLHTVEASGAIIMTLLIGNHFRNKNFSYEVTMGLIAFLILLLQVR